MTTQSGWRSNLMDHRSQGMFASQLTRLQPFTLFRVLGSWERGNLQSTLTSPHVKISGIMAVIDREVIILTCKKFRSRIEAVLEASGDFIK